MAFTDHCDVFASFHEDGFNRILTHVRLQRPSLFNYATAELASAPKRLCQHIPAHPIVAIRANPLVTIVDPLPIPGTDFGLDFCVQIADVRLDFHPGNQVPLPAELTPLDVQRLALFVRVCIGIACPPDDLVDQLIPPPPAPSKKGVRDDRRPPVVAPERPPGRPRPIPFRELRCVCLDAYVTGGVRIRTYHGKPYVEPFLQGFEIVDIKPQELEDALECCIKLVFKLSVLPGLRVLLEMTPLDIIKDKVRLSLQPMPTGPNLPNNPAIEDDKLKAFIKVEVI
jgi:hypothetical protein